MTLEFSHVALGQRILFGWGRAAELLAGEVRRRGATRVFVFAAESEASLVVAVCADIDPVLVYTEVTAHVPVATAERARAAVAEADADLLVSIGGGSTTGLAKAVALTTGLPIVAVPTTYAGSEATNVWGLTEASRKSTGVDDRVLPVAIVYDASLTLSLPVELTVASGLNALAHCIDSLWAPGADPINAALASEGIRALDRGLTLIAADGRDQEGREQAFYGAYLAAAAFASAGSGLHHKICHVLGGTYDLPHAQTHAVVLPNVLALNAPGSAGAAERIAHALSADSATAGLERLLGQLDAPRALRDYGFQQHSIPQAAGIILPVVPVSNPVPVDLARLERLLESAWSGIRVPA